MRKVNLYIETSSAALGKRERRGGYVLEYITKTGETVTRVGIREGRGTYNQEFLRTLLPALERLREPCELSVYGRNSFVLHMLPVRLGEWAEAGFISNGRPVMNGEEWKKIWEQVKIHKVNCQAGEHPYSAWLLREMEDWNEKKDKEAEEHTARPGK